MIKSLIYFAHIRSLSSGNIEPYIVKQLVSRIDFSHLERVVLDGCEYYWSFKHYFDSNRYKLLRTHKDYSSITRELTSVLLTEYATMFRFCTP